MSTKEYTTIPYIMHSDINTRIKSAKANMDYDKNAELIIFQSTMGDIKSIKPNKYKAYRSHVNSKLD